MELLLGLERRSVPEEAGIEVGKDPKDSLVDLGDNLFLGDLLLGCGYGHTYRSRSYWKSNLRHLVSLAGMQRDLIGFKGLEAGRSNSDFEGSCRQIVERKKARTVCTSDTLHLPILSLKNDLGVGN